MDSQHSSQLPKPWNEYPAFSFDRYKAWAKQVLYAEGFDLADWTKYLTFVNASAEAKDARVYHRPEIKQKDSTIASPPETPAALRAAFLKAVEGMVCKDRSATHGDAEDNFADIAAFWNIFTRHRKEPVQFTPQDVAAFMIMVKLSRLMSTPNHMDHWHDIAGYAACAGGILQKKLNNQEA